LVNMAKITVLLLLRVELSSLTTLQTMEFLAIYKRHVSPVNHDYSFVHIGIGSLMVSQVFTLWVNELLG